MTENSLYDRKSLHTITAKKIDWKEIVKDVVGFSNAEGGIIEFGIEDDAVEPDCHQRIPDSLAVMLVNNITGKSNGVQISTEKKVYANGGETILLHIRRSNGMTTTSDGKVFMRNGDNSEPITGEDLHRLAEDKGGYIWELQVSNYLVSECDKTRLEFVIQAIRNSDRASFFVKEKTDLELLRYFGLLDEENDVMTFLGVTFLGTRSQRQRISNAPTLQCIKYDEYGEKINKWTWDDFVAAPDEIIEQIWLSIPDWKESQEISDGLFGGVSSYIGCKVPFEFEAQRNDMPEWLMETGCLNVIRFDQFILVNAYFPYVDLSNDEYVKNRQRWDYELHDYLVRLTNQKPVILCGDLNIVNDDVDAWDGVSVMNRGCFTEWEHRDFNSLLSQTGLVDTYRYLHPDGRDYSYFFQNKAEYRLLNQGFRIDYCLMSEELLPYLNRSEILTDIVESTNRPLLIELEICARSLGKPKNRNRESLRQKEINVSISLIRVISVLFVGLGLNMLPEGGIYAKNIICFQKMFGLSSYQEGM